MVSNKIESDSSGVSQSEFQLIRERTSSGVDVDDPTAVLTWRNSAGTRVEVILHKHPGGAQEYHVEDDGERVATFPDRHRARVRASERIGGHVEGGDVALNPGSEAVTDGGEDIPDVSSERYDAARDALLEQPTVESVEVAYSRGQPIYLPAELSGDDGTSPVADVLTDHGLIITSADPRKGGGLRVSFQFLDVTDYNRSHDVSAFDVARERDDVETDGGRLMTDGGEDIKATLKRVETGERLKVLIDEPEDGDARFLTGRVDHVRTLPTGENTSVELTSQGTAVVIPVADRPEVSTRSGHVPMGTCIRVESLPPRGSDAVTPGGGAR